MPSTFPQIHEQVISEQELVTDHASTLATQSTSPNSGQPLNVALNAFLEPHVNLLINQAELLASSLPGDNPSLDLLRPGKMMDEVNIWLRFSHIDKTIMAVEAHISSSRVLQDQLESLRSHVTGTTLQEITSIMRLLEDKRVQATVKLVKILSDVHTWLSSPSPILTLVLNKVSQLIQLLLIAYNSLRSLR